MDLHVVGIWDHARLPPHHTISLRVDARQPDARRERGRVVASERAAALLGQAAAPLAAIGGAAVPDANERGGGGGWGADRHLTAQAATESDDVGDQLGAAHRERLAQMRAAAVPDQGDAPLVLLH